MKSSTTFIDLRRLRNTGCFSGSTTLKDLTRKKVFCRLDLTLRADYANDSLRNLTKLKSGFLLTSSHHPSITTWIVLKTWKKISSRFSHGIHQALHEPECPIFLSIYLGWSQKILTKCFDRANPKFSTS